MAQQDENATALPEGEARTPETPATAEKETKSNHLLESDGTDPDLKELEEAEAEVAAEAAAAAQEKPAEEVPVTPPAAAKEPVQVPVQAVTAERDKRHDAERIAREATQSAVYWKGVAEGRFPQPGARAPEAVSTPAPLPEVKQRRSEIRDQIAKMADKVDSGEMSVKDFETQKGQLEDELDDIRDASIRASVPQGSDLYLQTLTNKLESDNPWLADVPEDELTTFIPLAKKDLIAAGYDIKAKAGTPEADYQLRSALIERLRKHGYASGESTTPAPSTPAISTRPTAEQLAEKEAIRKDAPPQPRGAAAPADGWTPERIVDMDSVDLERLPMKDLNRILEGVTNQEISRRVNTAR